MLVESLWNESQRAPARSTVTNPGTAIDFQAAVVRLRPLSIRRHGGFMLTPLEEQIAADFRAKLIAVDDIPLDLVEQVHTLLVGTDAPTAVAVLESITGMAGDQTV